MDIGSDKKRFVTEWFQAITLTNVNWWHHAITNTSFNTLRLRQDGRHFADNTFNRIFVNENVRISIKFSLKFVPKGPTNNIPALV